MSADFSPAVERVHELAQRYARQDGQERIRIRDWLRSLFDDEDGKPALIAGRLGTDPADILKALMSEEFVELELIPEVGPLWTATRERSLAIRQDALLTTDSLLLAILELDPALAATYADLGLAPEAVRRILLPQIDESPGAEMVDPTFTVREADQNFEALRIIDANANRAREALRLIDDYGRFVRNDPALTEQVKKLRHAFTAALAPLTDRLLAARDVTGDVGTTIGVSTEYQRNSPLDVVRVNVKRLQEALRSVEEYGKILDPDLAHTIEQIRYRSYQLERMILSGAAARARLATTRLYVLLTGSQCEASLDWTIAEAAAGGADIFQLREKDLTDRELLDRAERVRRWTAQAETLFIMNDRPDLARLVGADGVHLGQDDLPVAAARRILGPDAIIGVSTHNLDQVNQALIDGADYIGVGPTFPSKTKSFERFAGLEFVTAVRATTTLPAFVLGGIDLSTIDAAVAAGAERIAVSAAIAKSDDPQAVARALRFRLPS